MDTRTQQVTLSDGGTAELATVIHDGHEYTNLGSVVADTYLAAYLKTGGIVTTWDGKEIGTYRVLSSWPTPRSYVSSRYYSVECFVNGVRYVGRSAGLGMLVKAKRSPRQ